MTDQISSDAQGIDEVGTTISSLDTVALIGTWELLDHGSCDGRGRLMALTPGEPAPICPVCHGEVRWRLTHRAPSVAADHQRAGPLP